MSFPLHYHGRTSWRSKSGAVSEPLRQEALSRLAKALADAKGSPEIRGNRVLFTGGFFRWVSNWNVLLPITDGHIEVQPEGELLVISYELHFKQLLMIAASVAGLLFLMSAVAGRSVPIVAIFLLCICLCCAMFGLNFLITLARFPMFIHAALKSL